MSQDTPRSQRSDQRTPTFGASAWIQRRRALLQEKDPVVPLRGPDPVRRRATTPSGSRNSCSSPRRTSFGNSEYVSKRNSLRLSDAHATVSTPSRHVDSDLRQKHYWRENLRTGYSSSQHDAEWCGSTSLPTLNKRCPAFSPPPPIRSIRSPAKNPSTPPREGQEPSARLMSLRSIDKLRHQLTADRMEQSKNRSVQNDEEMGWKPILAGPRAMPSPPPSPRTRRKITDSPAADATSAAKVTPSSRNGGSVVTPTAAAPPPTFTPKVSSKKSSPVKDNNQNDDLLKEVERLRMENAMLRAEKVNLQTTISQRKEPSPEGESHESPKMSEPKPHSPGRRFQPISEAAELDQLPDVPPDDDKGAAISDSSSSPEGSPQPSPTTTIKKASPSSQPLDDSDTNNKSSGGHNVSFHSQRRFTNPRPLEAFTFGDSVEEDQTEDGAPPVTSPAQVAIQSHFFADAARRRSSLRDPSSPAGGRRASIVMPNQPTPPEEALVSVDDIQEGIEYSEMLLKRSGSVSTVTRKQSCRSSITGLTGALAVFTESTVSDDDDGIQSSHSSSHSDGGDFLVSTTKHLPLDIMGDENDDAVDPPPISEIGSINERPPSTKSAKSKRDDTETETETDTESTAVESSTLSSETSD